MRYRDMYVSQNNPHRDIINYKYTKTMYDVYRGIIEVPD